MTAGSTRKVTPVDRDDKESKGWVSLRAMVWGSPRCVKCKPNKSGISSTMVIVNVMLIDHPCNPAGVSISNPENAWLEDEGLTLVTNLIERGETTVGGVARNRTVKFTERLRLRRGSIFEVSFFGKDGLRQQNSEDLPCDQGDILRIAGLTYSVRPGDKPDQQTGKPRLFRSISAAGAKHQGRIWEKGWEQYLNEMHLTILNWSVNTGTPVFQRMEIPEGFDYTKAADDVRKKKGVAAAAGGGGAAPDAAAAASAAGGSKKQFVLPPADSDLVVESEVVSIDDKREVGDNALTDASKKFKYEHPDILVPLGYTVCPEVLTFLRKANLPWTGYRMTPLGAMRLDPTQYENFRYEAKPDKNASGGQQPHQQQASNAPKVYEPKLKTELRVIQFKPVPAHQIQGLQVLQELVFEVTLFGETLRYYGICDPLMQMKVLPYLAASTPAVARTWINGQMSAQRSNPNDPNHFTYVLTGTTKRFQKDNKTNKSVSKPQCGVLADVACGIVSAGYRVSHAAACEILDALGARADYQDPRTERQVGADMSNPDIVNKYGKGKPDEANPVNGCVQRAPVLNCCESNINWRQYGGDYYFYVVTNWAEKYFDKYPALARVLAQMGADPTEALSKVFVELAKTGTLADAELLSYFGPSAHTEIRPNPDAPGKYMPTIAEPRPKAADDPFQCVVFAIRKEYAKTRGFDTYHGDNAYRDVLCKNEAYLQAFEKRITAKAGEKRKADVAVTPVVVTPLPVAHPQQQPNLKRNPVTDHVTDKPAAAAIEKEDDEAEEEEVEDSHEQAKNDQQAAAAVVVADEDLM
jgi:hypothetical protein